MNVNHFDQSNLVHLLYSIFFRKSQREYLWLIHSLSLHALAMRKGGWLNWKMTLVLYVGIFIFCAQASDCSVVCK